MKFKSDIEVQAGLKDSSGTAGTSGQVLSSNGTTVSWVNAGSSVASDVQNQVKAGVAINKGQAVYVTGADGTNIIVGLASNTSEATSSKTLGLLNATVSTNGFADVVQIGKLSGLNTSTATIGDAVWLGTNGNLIYGLANKPYAPAHLVYIGVVTRVNANNGEIFINVQNGFELKELHDVSAQTPANNNGLFYNTTSGLWEAKSISAAGGIEGSGTTNYVPKFTGTSAIGNSNITDNGAVVTISTDATINGVTIGSKGISGNTRVGENTFLNTLTGIGNSAFGSGALRNLLSTSSNNTSLGRVSFETLNNGSNNIAIGNGAGRNTSSATMVNCNQSIFIGVTTKALADNQTNQIVIGHDATGLGSNTTVLGNSSTAFGRWWGNLLLGTSTNTGQQLQVVGTTLLNGLQRFQGTTASDGGQLGAELLTTGTGDASWTGTSFATGYTHVAGSVTTLTSSVAAVVSSFYQITYTVTGRTVGSFTLSFGGNTTAALTATGATAPRTTTTGSLVITPTTDFDGTIVLSIKLISNSVATTTFSDSTGLVTNEIRVSNNSNNTFIGLNSGIRNTTGGGNTFFGTIAGSGNTTGSNNTFIGRATGQNNSIGTQNTFIGNAAGQNNSTANSNTFIGFSAGVLNTTGASNTIIGSTAGANFTTASNNVFLGQFTGNATTTGGSNTYIGQAAGGLNTTGAENVAVGLSAFYANTNGSNNVALGNSAGRFAGSGTTSMTSVNNSIYLGYRTRGLNATGSTNEIVIGYDVVGLGSNTTSIGNSSTTATAIYGDLLLGGTTDNGTDKLQVTGTANITGQLKLGSTITNGTFTYTLPGATGTLALTSDLAGYVPTSRTITINGVTQDLSANRSWTVSGGVSGSGSAGQVAFWNGTNSITGESNLFWDSTNDRLGIGTTSPSEKLDVANAAVTFGNESGANSSIYLKSGYDASNRYVTKLTTDYYGVFSLSTGTSSLASAPSSGSYSERMRITSGGNVGIGVTPSSWNSIFTALEINGGSIFTYSGNPGLQFVTNAYFDSSGWKYKNSSAAALYDQASGTHKFYTAPSGTAGGAFSFTEAMRIFNNGNIGINTGATDAGYKLDVAGTGRFSGSVQSSSLNVAGSGYFPSKLITLSGAEPTRYSGNIGLNIVYGNTLAMSFGTRSNNVDYDNTLNIINGNVGIGTNSPNQKLQVVGNISIDGANNGNVSQLSLTRTDTSWGINNETDLRFYSSNSNTTTPSTPRMVLTSSGNVGIGITSPSTLLHVNGAAGNQIRYSSPNVSNVLGVTGSDVGIVGTVTNHDLAIYTNASERMRITSGGNVGIGTTSPSEKLHIGGVGSKIAFDTTGVAASNWIGTTNDYWTSIVCNRGDNSRIDLTNANGIRLQVASKTIANIVTTGLILDEVELNVPKKIAFNSNRNTAGKYGDIEWYNYQWDSLIKASIGAETSGALWNGALVFRTSDGGVNATERMRIFSSGNVFIGSSPSDAGYKLEVSGTGRFIGSGFGGNGIYSTGANGGSGIYSVAGGSAGSGVYGYTNDLSSYGGTFQNAGAGSGVALRVLGFSTFSQAATFSSTVTATGFFNSSDIRLKEIVSQDGDIIEFTWKDGRDNKKHIGVIAQEVQKLYPDMVQEGTDEEKTLSVNYIELLVLKNRQLEKRIESLEKLILNSK